MRINVTVATDCASICVFDPTILASYPHEDIADAKIGAVRGVRDGLFFGFHSGSDGGYRIQVTDQDISGDERAYAVAALPPLGLKVNSGAACISGYGFQGDLDDFQSFPLASGHYLVSAYEVCWRLGFKWYRSDDTTPDNVPADYVLVVAPGEWPGASGIDEFGELQLETIYVPGVDQPPTFLFEVPDRTIGTPPGAILASTAIQSRVAANGYCLKECGVEHFKADLDRYPAVKWKDRVEFEVLEVDYGARRILGRFIRIL